MALSESGLAGQGVSLGPMAYGPAGKRKIVRARKGPAGPAKVRRSKGTTSFYVRPRSSGRR